MSDTKIAIYNAKINLFCENLGLFLDDLSVLYPNDLTLKMSVTMFNTVSGFYKENIVKEFMEIIKPFSEKILKRDESFFLNEAHEHLPDDQWLMNEVEKIRSIWVDPNTSQETKETIWRYMTTFVKIGKSLKLC